VRNKTLVLLGVFCLGSVGFAQEPLPNLANVELSGGYSVNTDYVANRRVLLVADQKVSPFFSHGSGPIGFELSATRYVRRGLGITANLSFYSDTFPSGRATSCHPAGCATGLTFEASGQALYLTLGLQWKSRRDRRFAPFARTLGGIVHATSRFAMAGSGGAEPFMGGLILFNSAGTPSNGPITYSDSNSDTGLALSLGGGFDIRLREQLGLRVAIDYDPTFLVRPVLHDPIVDAGGRIVLPDTTLSERNRQDHLRATIGIVWGIR
jgi:hypothetical protein